MPDFYSTSPDLNFAVKLLGVCVSVTASRDSGRRVGDRVGLQLSFGLEAH